MAVGLGQVLRYLPDHRGIRDSGSLDGSHDLLSCGGRFAAGGLLAVRFSCDGHGCLLPQFLYSGRQARKWGNLRVYCYVGVASPSRSIGIPGATLGRLPRRRRVGCSSGISGSCGLGTSRSKGLLQRLHLLLEALDVREVTVHAGKAYVGDPVQGTEALHDHPSDVGAWYLRPAQLLKLGLDVVHQLLYSAGGKGPLDARLEDAVDQLVPVVLLPAVIALGHHESRGLDALVGGVTQPALQALTAAAYALRRVPGVDDL